MSIGQGWFCTTVCSSRDSHGAGTILVTWPSLQDSLSLELPSKSIRMPLQFHFLEDLVDSPSNSVPRRLAQSPGLAEATYATLASSPSFSSLPFLTVCHSGCLLPSFLRGSQYRFTGVQESCCLQAHHLWPLWVPHPNGCPAHLFTSSDTLKRFILTKLQALLERSQSTQDHVTVA